LNNFLRYQLPLLAVLVAFLASPIAEAQKVHYRWINDRGYPVHSDRPPPKGTDYEVIETGSDLIRKVSGDEGAVPAETMPRVGNEFTPIDTRPDETGPNPELCQRARENLAALNSGAEISMRNDQGEERVLGDDEVEAQRAKANDSIRRYCQ